MPVITCQSSEDKPRRRRVEDEDLALGVISVGVACARAARYAGAIRSGATMTARARNLMFKPKALSLRSRR